MPAAELIREARAQAGLTQSALAQRAGTSQATVSAYESGRKVPSVETLERLLGVMAARLTTVPSAPRRRGPSRAELRRAGRVLADVLELAEALPVKHDPQLRYPRLDVVR